MRLQILRCDKRRLDTAVYRCQRLGWEGCRPLDLVYLVVVCRVKHRAKHGHTQGAAYLAGRVVHGGAYPGLAVRDGTHHGVGGGAHSHADPQGYDAHADNDGEVTGIQCHRAGEVEEPYARKQDADSYGYLGAQGPCDARRDKGGYEYDEGHRQEAHAGLKRRIPLDRLEILPQEKERTEKPEGHQREGQVGAAERFVAEELEGKDGVLRA